MSDLFGGTISGGDVSIGSLRSLFGSYVTLNGTLSKSGYDSSDVSLTLNLGTSSGNLNNEWATMSINNTTRTITANIKASDTLLSSIGIKDLLTSSIGVLPTYVKAGSSTWISPSSEEGRGDIRTAIGTMLGMSWSIATLGDLKGEEIQFKDQNSNIWTIEFK